MNKNVFLIANDMPFWLQDIIQKVGRKLTGFEISFMRKYMNSLPKKTNNNYKKNVLIKTFIHNDIINILNDIDYTNINNQKQDELKLFLVKYFGLE